MGQLHELRLRSDAFIVNMNVNIALSIEQNEKALVELNKGQMKDRQVDSFDKYLPEYSSKWKSIKGLTHFNLFDTGDFQKAMFLNVNYPQFSISSNDWKLGKLIKRVGIRMFGIAPSNQQKAKILNLISFTNLYKLKVLSK